MDFSVMWKELGGYRLSLSVLSKGKSFSISCHHINPKSVLQTHSSLLHFTGKHLRRAQIGPKNCTEDL